MTIPNTNRKPVFIHAMWRTGSTYIWSKFRQQLAYRAYFEPFHEQLLKSTKPLEYTEQNAIMMAKWLRHPVVDKPYIDEYPFKPEGGVEFFCKQFSYQRYCLEPDEEDPELSRYISNLIAFAEKHQQTPVFQFNRSLMRAQWLAKHFQSHNIVVLRNPIGVWKSFVTRDLLYHHYFPAMLCCILGQNKNHPLLGHIATANEIPCFRADTIEEEFHFYNGFALPRINQLYSAFYEFYILTCIHDLACADCVIDTDTITADEDIRRQTEARLEFLGHQISLSDAALPALLEYSDEELEWQRSEHGVLHSLLSRLPEHLWIAKDDLHRNMPLLGPYFRQTLMCALLDRPLAANYE